jgi:hypothetical protein
VLAGEASGGSRTSARLNVVIARRQSRGGSRRRRTRAVFGSTRIELTRRFVPVLLCTHYSIAKSTGIAPQNLRDSARRTLARPPRSPSSSRLAGSHLHMSSSVHTQRDRSGRCAPVKTRRVEMPPFTPNKISVSSRSPINSVRLLSSELLWYGALEVDSTRRYVAHVSRIQSIIAFSGLPTTMGLRSRQYINGAIVAPPPMRRSQYDPSSPLGNGHSPG